MPLPYEMIGPRGGRLLELLGEQCRLERQRVVARLRLDHGYGDREPAGQVGPAGRAAVLVDVEAVEAQPFLVRELLQSGGQPRDVRVVDGRVVRAEVVDEDRRDHLGRRRGRHRAGDEQEQRHQAPGM